MNDIHRREKKHATKKLIKRERLDIKKDFTEQGYNNNQLAVKSNAWDPFLKKMKFQNNRKDEEIILLIKDNFQYKNLFIHDY